MSISKKLTYSMFIFTSLTLIVVSIILSFMFSSFSSDKMKTETNRSLSSFSQKINSKIDDIDVTFEMAQIYSKGNYDMMTDLKLYADGTNHSLADIQTSNEEVKGIFRTLIFRNSDIYFMSLVIPKADTVITYSNSDKGFSKEFSPLESSWYQHVKRSDNHLRFTLEPQNSTLLNENCGESILFYKNIYETYTKNFLGTLVIGCRPSYFDFIPEEVPENILGFQLTADQGKIFQKNFPEYPKENTLSVTTNTDRQPIELSVILDNSETVLFFRKLFLVVCLILLFMLAAAFLIARRASDLFTWPIINLTKIMKIERLNSVILEKESTYLDRNDEIGFLYREYQKMLKAIKKHINDSISYEQSLMTAEMNVYKNQIDSHFLFNTLESINSLAEIEDLEEISTMSLSLSNMFRYTSNGFINDATLEEEIKNVRDYLKIQNIRFQKNFNVQFHLEDPQDKDQRVPRIILQPLVENAIYHGLNRGKIDGNIIVTTKKTDHLTISVEDDGIGLSADKLKEVIVNLTKASQQIREKTSHIALINIQSRIQHTYGNDAGIEIISKENHGTKVSIILPLEDKGELR